MCQLPTDESMHSSLSADRYTRKHTKENIVFFILSETVELIAISSENGFNVSKFCLFSMTTTLV